jgi:hypothetical protein
MLNYNFDKKRESWKHLAAFAGIDGGLSVTIIPAYRTLEKNSKIAILLTPSNTNFTMSHTLCCRRI